MGGKCKHYCISIKLSYSYHDYVNRRLLVNDDHITTSGSRNGDFTKKSSHGIFLYVLYFLVVIDCRGFKVAKAGLFLCCRLGPQCRHGTQRRIIIKSTLLPVPRWATVSQPLPVVSCLRLLYCQILRLELTTGRIVSPDTVGYIVAVTTLVSPFCHLRMKTRSSQMEKCVLDVLER